MTNTNTSREERLHTGPINQHVVKVMTDTDYVARFKARCVVTEAGCWECSGFQHKLRGVKSHDKGYVIVSYRGKMWGIHRLMYTLLVGPIPDGLVCCHRCDNPPCCNPEHIFLGTESENILDAVSKKRDRQTRKTCCPRGHVYNQYYAKGNRRRCTACDRIRQRMAAGWSEDEAVNAPPLHPGYHRPRAAP